MKAISPETHCKHGLKLTLGCVLCFSEGMATVKSEPKPTLTHERIIFRLLQTPCCSSLLCWVNPRLPNYCPECGEFIYPQIREGIMLKDEDAQLTYNTEARV